MISASKYNHHAHMKKISDYCKAYDRNKQEYQLQKQRQYSEMIFKPTVNKKSRHLANKTRKKSTNGCLDNPRKIKRIDKLRKDTELTFMPRINKRSRLITSRAKQVKTRMLSPRRMTNRDLKYVDLVDGSRNDEVICRLEYDIDESAHNLLRSLNLASDEKSYELRNMSDLVPARNTQNEYEITSRDALNLFGAGNQEFQRQLMFIYQQQQLDLNDLEDNEVVQQHMGNIPEESQDQSNVEFNQRNHSQDIIRHKQYETHNCTTDHEFYDNDDVQDLQQHELGHTCKDRTEQMLQQNKQSYHTPDHRVRTLCHLDTVKEATVEETYKNEATPYHRGTTN